MTLRQLLEFPECIEREKLKEILARGSTGIHESVFRSYHILARVEQMLDADTPPAVILAFLWDVRDIGRPVKPEEEP